MGLERKKIIENTKFLEKNKKVCEQNNETVRNEWNLPKTKEYLKLF